MTTLNINTNVIVDGKATFRILHELTRAAARALGKSESNIMILLNVGVPMLFGGTTEPAAYGELVSAGGLSADMNRKVSKAVASVLEPKLSIPPSRLYITFCDVKGSNLGWNGTTSG